MREDLDEKFGLEKTDSSPEDPERREFLASLPSMLVAIVAAVSGATSCAETAPRLWKMKWGPEATRIDRPGHTEWEEIGVERLRPLLKRVSRGEKIALMIGAHRCAPCKTAQEWWSDKNIGPFNPVYFSQPNPKTGDMKTPELPDEVRYFLYGSGKNQSSLPLLLFIHKQQNGKKQYYHEFVLKLLSGLKECTAGAAKWLDENKY